MSSMCDYKLPRRLHQRLKSGTEVRKMYAFISCRRPFLWHLANFPVVLRHQAKGDTIESWNPSFWVM